MADRLRDKVTLITGAGSGIGRATALVFAAEGAKVVSLDSNREAAAETARLVEEGGGEAIALAADVSREEDVAAAVEATVARFGRLDVLVASEDVEFVEDRDTIRQQIVQILQNLLKEEEKVDAGVRRKISSQKREILEGSEEWDILYRKYYGEEMKRMGVVHQSERT